MNEETGQWTVGGMGDLHLEVIMSRIRREHKVDARLGPLAIAYRESPLHVVHAEDCWGSGRVSGLVGGRDRTVLVDVSVKSTGVGAMKPLVSNCTPTCTRLSSVYTNLNNPTFDNTALFDRFNISRLPLHWHHSGQIGPCAEHIFGSPS